MTLIEEINKRRTFAIISHPDAGKTTLTEKRNVTLHPVDALNRYENFNVIAAKC